LAKRTYLPAIVAAAAGGGVVVVGDVAGRPKTIDKILYKRQLFIVGAKRLCEALTPKNL
jgi:hypothetical protein